MCILRIYLTVSKTFSIKRSKKARIPELSNESETVDFNNDSVT